MRVQTREGVLWKRNSWNLGPPEAILRSSSTLDVYPVIASWHNERKAEGGKRWWWRRYFCSTGIRGEDTPIEGHSKLCDILVVQLEDALVVVVGTRDQVVQVPKCSNPKASDVQVF